MRKLPVIALLCLLAVFGCRALPEGEKGKTAVPEAKPVVVDENTNIHYTGQFCSECHYETPAKDGNTYLKFNGDYGELCRCHHGMSPGYCHPLEVDIEKGQKIDIPSDFPLTGGKFTCNTCHDVYRQCQKRLFDRWMLRGAPYPQKTDFCYNCHAHRKGDYEKLNAHHQIKADGTLFVKMCLYCHEEKPDEKTATYEEVTFVGDIKALCRRCHQIAGNHSGDFDHMAVNPSDKMLKRMKAMEKEFNIILPLTQEGKMTCITCHNPHEKGVIPEDKPSAMGADSQYRHRLPGKLCKECHQM